jgi:hypothetical protein
MPACSAIVGQRLAGSACPSSAPKATPSACERQYRAPTRRPRLAAVRVGSSANLNRLAGHGRPSRKLALVPRLGCAGTSDLHRQPVRAHRRYVREYPPRVTGAALGSAAMPQRPRGKCRRRRRRWRRRGSYSLRRRHLLKHVRKLRIRRIRSGWHERPIARIERMLSESITGLRN